MFFWKFVSPRSSLALITAAASTVPTPTLVSSFQRNSCSIGGGKAKRANTFPSLLGGWTAPSTASCTNPSRGFFHRVERTFGGFASTARFQPWYYRQTSSTRTMSLSAGSSSADSDTGRQSRSSASSALVRVALLQFHVTEDKALNIETARNFILRAKDQNASMVVLPEVWNSPYATSAFAEYAEEISVSSVEDDDGTISTGNPSVSFRYLKRQRTLEQIKSTITTPVYALIHKVQLWRNIKRCICLTLIYLTKLHLGKAIH